MSDTNPLLPATSAAPQAAEVRDRFWENLPLSALTPSEWELLCDGCGQCCLVREIDDEALTVFAACCNLLDIPSSRCSNYDNRMAFVPECTQLTPQRVANFDWLPNSCAYRRRHLNRPIPEWHPLKTGNREAMEAQGITVSRYAIHQNKIADEAMPDHIIASWPLQRMREQLRQRTPKPKRKR